MKKKLNVELLKKVQQHITEEPKRYDQFAVVRESSLAPCGTVACIAGWANVLSGSDPKSEEAQDLDKAAVRLGVETCYELFPEGFGCFHFLFDLEGWPSQFVREHEQAKTFKARAKAACKRIDYLIKTGK